MHVSVCVCVCVHTCVCVCVCVHATIMWTSFNTTQPGTAQIVFVKVLNYIRLEESQFYYYWMLGLNSILLIRAYWRTSLGRTVWFSTKPVRSISGVPHGAVVGPLLFILFYRGLEDEGQPSPTTAMQRPLGRLGLWLCQRLTKECSPIDSLIECI